MELETIHWARQRRLMERVREGLGNHEGRIIHLEGRSETLSRRSENLWEKLKTLAELSVPVGSILGFLGRHWGLIILIPSALWAAVKWLWKAFQLG